MEEVSLGWRCEEEGGRRERERTAEEEVSSARREDLSHAARAPGSAYIRTADPLATPSLLLEDRGGGATARGDSGGARAPLLLSSPPLREFLPGSPVPRFPPGGS